MCAWVPSDSAGCLQQARSLATIPEKDPLTQLRRRLTEHKASSVEKSTLMQWISDIETAPTVSAEGADSARQVSFAGPLVRSGLVGVAVGTTTPFFILLPCTVGFVPVTALMGPEGLAAAIDLALPALLNTPIALANFSGSRRARRPRAKADTQAEQGLHAHSNARTRAHAHAPIRPCACVNAQERPFSHCAARAGCMHVVQRW